MKKILLIGTGGTIACTPSEQGMKPTLSAAQLLEYVNAREGIDTLDLFSMDSSNIQPEEWQVMSGAVNDCLGRYDGVVITHGTDTMAYTSAMLSFMLSGIGIPVVLTGAQKSIIIMDSDGRSNLADAITAAQNLPGGVYVCFEGMVMLGSHAVKTRTTSLNAFESINYPYLGVVREGQYLKLNDVPKGREYRYFADIDPRVALIKLIPGTAPELIDAVAGCNIHGVVVEAFGLGGVHNIRRDHVECIKRLIEQGIPVVLTSQCLYEQSTPETYEVSRPLMQAGVISAASMTTEASVTKLMYCLGHTRDMARVSAMMLEDIASEMA